MEYLKSENTEQEVLAFFKEKDNNGVGYATVDKNLVFCQKEDYSVKFTSRGQNTVSIVGFNTASRTLSFQYSYNGETWNTWESNDGETTGEYTSVTFTPLTFGTQQQPDVYVRGSNPKGLSFDSATTYTGFYFGNNNSVIVRGNLMSLIDYTDESLDTLGDCDPYTFASLFSGQTALIDAKNLMLPATALSEFCYFQMFTDCSRLYCAPRLPAMQMVNSCYKRLFWNCSNLVACPQLPATVMAPYAYDNMFRGCSSITVPPELPATDLSNCEYCYRSMFGSCTNLITAPELPATNLSGAQRCYAYMFSACTSLTTAPELPATTLAPNCYYSMFSSGTSLTTAPELPATTLAPNCYTSMFGSCISLTTAPELPATTLAPNCYDNMFSSCSNLKTPPSCLPAVNLSGNNFCYRSMFRNCESLESAPIICATTMSVSGAAFMFQNCMAITTAPALPATTLSEKCYYAMFYGCTNLTTAPELPATTLTNSCYYAMFYMCTELTTAPVMSATNAVGTTDACAYMYEGCSKLVNVPSLSLTGMGSGCCYQMFSACTSLTTAPTLPATTLASGCYKEMFIHCSALTSITCFATDISAANSTLDWVKNVSASGVFIKDQAMTGWTIGTSGIPDGWSYGSRTMIEYLQSTGAQYIDTNVTPNNNQTLRVVTSFSCPNVNRRVILGNYYISSGDNKSINIEVYSASSSNVFRLFTSNSNNSSSQVDTHTLPVNTVINADTTLNFSGGQWNTILSYGGNEYTFQNNARTDVAVQTRNLRIFLDHRADPSPIANPLTIYAMQIYLDGVKVRDFVPCKIGSDGFLYDTVSKTFFGNSGTGSFTLGPDVT